jgi:hypothetical protein
VTSVSSLGQLNRTLFDLLVSELRARFRHQYKGSTLRENLRDN